MSIRSALTSGYCQAAITVLTPALRDHIMSSMEDHFGDDEYMDKIQDMFKQKQYKGDVPENLDDFDFSLLLRVFCFFWKKIFSKRAQHNAINLAWQCIHGRNKLSHQKMASINDYETFLKNLLLFSQSVYCLAEASHTIKQIIDIRQDGLNAHYQPELNEPPSNENERWIEPRPSPVTCQVPNCEDRSKPRGRRGSPNRATGHIHYGNSAATSTTISIRQPRQRIKGRRSTFGDLCCHIL